MTVWTLVVMLGIFAFIMGIVPMLVWAERKVSARIQNRRGPNIVGPFGLLQPLADAIKLLTKEETIPAGAERWLFRIAPALAFIPPAVAMAVIPFGHTIRVGDTEVPLVIADLELGLVFVLAMTSLAVYAVAFGGWAANSKYPLLASVRASAQTISYEIALGLAVVAVIMTAGSVHMGTIIEGQQGTIFGFLPSWNIFYQPLAAVLFIVAAFAENNRLPFDMPEAEAELVGGYHTEHSGMKFGVYFLGEYVSMIVMASLGVTLFLGGWTLPGVIDPASTGVASGLLSVAVFVTKVLVILFIYIWVRWTLPRFRYDQLMSLGWKALVPLGLANLLLTGVVGLL